MNFTLYRFLFCIILLCNATSLWSQLPTRLRGLGNRGGASGSGNDSLERRNKFEDSLTLTFKYLDSTQSKTLDSSVSDYTTRFPIPATFVYLGNIGTAARSILYNPVKPGWDPGFHAFDLYKFQLQNTRFYTATRPYTELGYMLGSQTQQLIEILHTQNFKPHWNAAFQYRLINAPGFFKNQSTNHNNYLISSWYQSPNRRYNNYGIVVRNKLQSAENGGIRNDTNYLDDPVYSDRFSVPTKLGGNRAFSRDFFNADLTTGNRYKEFNFLMRQQYDFGRKDSIVTDSTVIPLFYPRLRVEHTLTFGKYKYLFRDTQGDSAYYNDRYGIDTIVAGSFSLTDTWNEIRNNFSIYQFPDAKNQSQFIKAGLEYQLLNGRFDPNVTTSIYNFIGQAEYRNRTRNQKWDAIATGRLWINGYNAGDFHAYVSLQRLLSSKLGSLQVGFENSNRSPSFIYDNRSSFYIDRLKSFSKENVTHIFASIINPLLKFQLRGHYYVIGNYLYLRNFYQLEQQSSLFTLIRLEALKSFKISRYWNLYSEVYVQQKAGNTPLNVPLIFTRNRLAFEGNFFKNLNLSTGLEMRYHTPYYADNYSPVLGQFFHQDSIRIANRPELHAFFNFRIRSFKAYVRAENLNTLQFSNTPGFTAHNFAAPDYPYPGLVLRLGIYWSFVN